jgi:hypothetical protein
VKNYVFWDKMPFNPLKVKRRFEGTFRLHLQVRSSALLATCFHTGLLLFLFSYPENGGDCLLTFSGLSDVKSQKSEIFMTASL